MSGHDISSDVKDIHDVLEVTVYDEDKDHKFEFLGKIKIPLLKIKVMVRSSLRFFLRNTQISLPEW